MKKLSLSMVTILLAAVMLFTGILPMESAQAAGDVIIQDLTAKSIFDDLGDALNYGTVAREWEQNAHAETSVCVDYMDRYDNTVFANTDSTYFHAMNYTLEAGISAPQSLNGMSFALYKYEGGKYVRCAGTEKTISSNTTSATLTWEIGNELKNTRLYVFQISGEDYIENGQQNSAGLTVTNGPSLSSSAHNNNYIGKMVYHKQQGEGDSLGIFNDTKYSPSLTFGPETRAYYKKWNQELQKDEYFVIDPNDKDLEVQNVLINYYYTDQADFDPERDDATLKMGYMKMDGMSFVKGQFVKKGDVIGVTYVEEKGYADKLLDQAEKVSKEWGNLGGGQITSLTPNATGGSTVTGPVTDDGYVVSLYDMEVGEDGIFQVKKDTGWNGIPVAENEYVIINLICSSKDGEVLMGDDAADITYFYKEGQTQGEGVAWGGADSNSSQRVIFNFVYADENGVMQPFEGTIKPTARHGGTLLAPKAYVKLEKEVHNGAIIADKVNNGQEIHQRNLAPLGRRTWITMNGGYLMLEKASLGYDWFIPPYGEWVDMSDKVDLSGAVFGVYADDSCSADSLVTTITTDKEGVAKSELLASGTYWIKEITPLKDHNLETKVVEVEVKSGETVQAVGGGYFEENGGHYEGMHWVTDYKEVIPESKFVNQQNNGYVDLRIVKHDEFGNNLQGAQFGVYTRQLTGYGPYPQFKPQYTYTLIASATTNRNGVAILDQVPLRYQDVTYYIREIAAPDGYRVGSEDYIAITLTSDDRDQLITIDGNGNADGVAFTNTVIRGNMALKKVDSQTNANLEGAEFTIYSDRNCTDVVGVMTTKRGGDADSKGIDNGKDLIPGIYYVKETKAPNGYLLPEKPTVYQVKVLAGKMVDVVTGDEINRASEANGISNEQGINIAGSKVWYDEGFEGSRPQEIQVNLYKGEDTNPCRSVTVSQKTDWKFSFPNLRRYDDEGKEIVYTVKEDLRGNGHLYYTYVKENEKDGNVTVTIANAVKKTMITGTKTWEDTAGYDQDRPNDITFSLLLKDGEDLVPVKDQNGQLLKAVGGSYNNYKFEFRDLPSYDAEGNKAEYVVKEAESDKYVLVDSTFTTKTEQGNTYLEFSLVNRLTVPLKGTKVWADAEDAEGDRPDNVTLVICDKNGRELRPQPDVEIVWDKETDTDVWSWEVLGLPKYDKDGNENVFTVKEQPVRGYKTSYKLANGTTEKGYTDNGGVITNAKEGRIRLYKESFDERKDGKPVRLGGAVFQLFYDEAHSQPVDGKEYTTLSDGREIGKLTISPVPYGTYWVYETKAPEGYELDPNRKAYKVVVDKPVEQPSDVEGDRANEDNNNNEVNVIVNKKITEETVSVKVSKAWLSADGNSMNPPADTDVYVDLYAGDEYLEYEILNQENNWVHTWEGLPKCNDDGSVIQYRVEENKVNGFVSTVQKDEATSTEDTYSFTLTNKEVEILRLEIPVVKVLEGAESDEEFTFKLESICNKNSAQPAPMPTYSVVYEDDARVEGKPYSYKTVTSKGSKDGTPVSFGEIIIKPDEVDLEYGYSYLWRVSEVIPESKTPGVTYDDGYYDIAFSFYVNADGQISIRDEGLTIYRKNKDGTQTAVDYNNGSYTLPFTNKIETTSISVQKEWVGGEPADADLTDRLTVHKVENGSLSDALKDVNGNVLRPSKSADGKTYTFSDLPAGYTYAVKEAEVPGYATTYPPMNIGEADGQNVKKDFALDGETIKNTLKEVKASFGFNKYISNGEDEEKYGAMPVQDLPFTIEPMGTYDSTMLSFDKVEYTVDKPFTVTVKGDKTEEFILTQLNLTIWKPGTYQFKISENLENVPDGWVYKNNSCIVSIPVTENDDGSLQLGQILYSEKDGEASALMPEFLNFYHGLCKFTITKEWTRYNGEGEEDITLELYYRKQLSYNEETNVPTYSAWEKYPKSYTVEVTKEGNAELGERATWSIYIDNLPEVLDNKLIDYGVMEISPKDGYTVIYEDSDGNLIAEDEKGRRIATYGSTIYNEVQYTSISVNKEWVGGAPANADLTNYLTVHKVVDGVLSDALKDDIDNVLRPSKSADGKTYTFSNLLPGYTYAVKEAEVEGYVTTYPTRNDAALAGETIQNAKITTTGASITLKKTVKNLGNVPYAGAETFTFIVDYSSEVDETEGSNLSSGVGDMSFFCELKNGETKEVHFNFTQSGTYTVTVTEGEPAENPTDGMVYSEEIYRVIYRVELVGNALTVTGETWQYAQDVHSEELPKIDKPDAVEFVNTYEKYALTLKKTDILDENKGLEDAVYGLYAEDDPDCQGTPVYTITTGEDGTGKVEDIAKGTYWLKEITAPEGYDVDPNPVKVMVPPSASSPDGSLNVNVADYPLGQVKVKKAWAGDTEANRPDSITVQLMKDGKAEGNPIRLTAENDWAAEVDGLQMYNPANGEEISYTWKETVPAGYNLTGNVTKTENGVEVTTLTNTLYTAGGEIQFSGEKTLTGRKLEEGEFSFELSGGNLEKAEVVKNAADGTFRFSEIAYTQEDAGKKYTYTVKEQTDTVDTIIYDETVYEITVEVQDNQDGTLTAEVVSWKKNGQLMENQQLTISFENNYVYAYTDISGAKTMDGRAFREGDSFTLELWEENGTEPIDAMTIMPTEGGSEGFGFDMMVFDKQDIGKTYTYLVKENIPAGAVDGKLNGVIYDQTVYTVKLAVTFENDELKVTRTYWKGADEVERLLFSNGYEADGGIQFQGTKTLTGDRALAAEEFSFELTGGNLEKAEVVKNAADGTFRFSEIAYTEADINKEYVYTVKEVIPETKAEGITYDETIYTVKVKVTDAGDGKLNAEVISETAKDALNFTNTYDYKAQGSIQFSGTKTLTGDRALAAEEFSFELTGGNLEKAEVVKNAADGTFRFSEIAYTEADINKEYVYTVKEVIPETKADGITYDETIYTVKVKVTDAGDGKLNAEVISETAKDALNFTNTYDYKAQGSIQFSGTKTLTGDRALAAEEFSFELSGGNLEKAEVVKNAADGTFRFSEIAYTEADINKEYVYTVKEVIPEAKAEGITYDENIYTVKVKVTDAGDGKLNAEVISETAKDALNFVNKYEKYTASGELTLDVEKAMMGREFVSGDMFTFTISAVSGVPMPEKTMVTITPSSGKTAKVDFGKILFTEADINKEYVYTVKELAGQKEGITYDDKFHTVTVKLTDDGKGNILATPTYADGSRVTLTNMYNAEGELTLDVEKTIKGRTFKTGDSFTFTITAAENVPMPEKTEVTLTPTEGTTAKVDFGKITYSLADAGKTYEYTLKEVAGQQDGITYDANAYTVKVTVADNGQGGLNVTPAYEAGSRVTFVNTYGAAGTYQLTATKELIGKKLTDGQFTFVLKNEQGKELATATNTADGQITFKAFNFSQSDIGKTYTYYVSERMEGLEGYTYDTTVFEVKLTVSDNSDGTLTVTASGLPEGGMKFRNSYFASTNVVFYKKWQGKEGPAISLTLYQNGVKMDPQPEYVKVGNVYTYEGLPLYDENEKLFVYSATESFMDGYMTIYENKAPYAHVADQVMNGGTIINRGVSNVSVRKVWQGLAEGEQAPEITLSLYCNGVKLDKATPVPDKDGWYHYYNLPTSVDGVDAVYTVKEEAMEGFNTIYLSTSGEEAECAMNGDTIQNRKIPKTGDNTPIGLWMAVGALSAMGFVLAVKKRKTVG